jgi:Uncharacterized membrane-associated protein
MTFKDALDFILHVDDKLLAITQQYGVLTYLILFLIIFCETGLVVTPFLPGDSLLFAAGTISGNPNSGLNPLLMGLLLFVAAVLGDTVNYALGKTFGARIAANPNSKILKKEHLDKTHAFFEKHGGKAIILARFAPIVRTFAPFVAGMGAMSYGPFLLYNVVGGALWVGICTGAGYFFGSHPWVQKNFEVVVIAIVVISIIPMLVEIIRHRKGEVTAADRAILDEGSETGKRVA